ncbi:MAG TPA: hypothetical protein VJ486_06465 [Geothrix sp.]|nr:hypothetical protein [Geothrix sp.]
MKKILLPLLLVAAPLGAQSFEAGVFIGQQTYKEFNYLGFTAKPDSKTVASARLGYSIVDLGPALFQITAGFQPESKANITNNAGVTGELKQSHWSVGAMFNFKAVVAFGAGVEYRSEKLDDGAGTSTTYGRPWARVNAGLAFPTPLVKPFIGLEVAAPLSSKSNDVASPEDGLKSMAPKMQIGVYGGIRF